MSNILHVKIDGKESEIDLDRLTFAEARAIEKVSGKPFAAALGSGKKKVPPDMTAMQAIVWVTLKRHNPGIKFTDLDDYALADLDIELDSDDEAEGEPNPSGPVVEN